MRQSKAVAVLVQENQDPEHPIMRSFWYPAILVSSLQLSILECWFVTPEILQMVTNVSKEHIASIFRVEDYRFLRNVGNHETTWRHNPESNI
jgi:hypothetical protein